MSLRRIHFLTEYFLKPFLGLLLSIPIIAHGVLDLDGNGASELWEGRFPGVIVDERDSDGDGLSNASEAICGTDPFNPTSVLRLEAPQFDQDQQLVTFHWISQPGKQYSLQVWHSLQERWESILTIDASSGEQLQDHQVSFDHANALYRLVVRDLDEDHDGLSAWEEALIGWDDQNAKGSGSPNVLDYESALTLLEDPQGLSLVTGEVIAQRLPTADEAARFLVQASFGPTKALIQEVRDLGLTGWFESQTKKSLTTTQTHMFRTQQPVSALYWRQGWWRAALITPDQLRHRIAYALSQIFVVNNEPGTVIGDNALVQAAYYDPFIKNAFGAYRDLLNHVTYSSTMGFYLSHLNNRKSDLSINRFPDENFAREIMQLFSIGLWELELDGSRKRDAFGNDIPTYDNSVITELAKVFTGMSHSRTNGSLATSFYDLPNGNDYIYPMKVWDEEHEPGPKVLFRGITIPEGQSGEEDVQQALDALANHDNTAPFMCRLLIQRLTSSNPSTDYIRRVVTAWQTSGGTLDRVVRAILFDPEAREVGIDDGQRGKLREPLLRMIHIMRAFAPSDQSGKYGALVPTLKTELGQFVMSSPTVFNFYLPDFTPVGPIQDAELVAPEFQIATSSTLLTTHDRLKSTASSGHWVTGVDYTEELEMLQSPDTLIDHLDNLLTYGQMSAVTREAVKERILGEAVEAEKVKVAVQTIVTSPEFSVLR